MYFPAFSTQISKDVLLHILSLKFAKNYALRIQAPYYIGVTGGPKKIAFFDRFEVPMLVLSNLNKYVTLTASDNGFSDDYTM